MKFLNRRLLGIEVFLAAQSPVFSRQNDLTSEQLTERLDSQFYSVKLQLARDISDVVTELQSDKYDVSDLIPEKVKALADMDFSVNAETYKPFFDWMIGVWRDNDFSRSSWLSEIQHTARYMPKNAEDFLVTFATKNIGRVILDVKDGVLYMSVNERKWGKCSFSFPDFSAEENTTFPALGFVTMMEAERLEDGRYQFEILIDTEFSSLAEPDRLLRPDKWKTVRITSGEPEFFLTPVNYMKQLRLKGLSTLEIVLRSSDILVEKLSILGESNLSAAEKNALNMAFLLSGTSQMLEAAGKKGGVVDAEYLSKLFDNRYAFGSVIRIFRDEDAQPEVKLLEEALEKCECEQYADALKKTMEFAKSFAEGVKSGRLWKLVSKLEQIFSDIVEQAQPSEALKDALFYSAVNELSAHTDKVAGQFGFEGTFPHYSRIRGNKAEYIFFLHLNLEAKSDLGKLPFCFTAEAAQLKLTREQRSSRTVFGLPLSEVSAADVANLNSSAAKSGNLSFALGEAARITVFAQMTDMTTEFSDEEKILSAVKSADSSMKGKALSYAQRSLRKKMKLHSRSFIPTLLHVFPRSIFVCLASFILYITGNTLGWRYFDLDMSAAIIPIMLSGAVAAVIYSALSCAVKSKKLWRF
ncbi:MAG: hypothetical protein LBL82_06235 [Oscillospiraceae bacterium]|jgi:hypothetical protein|nr:hypothetical protein [Oscillospiraceae bacterium]